jgi:hypothetical protein
MLTRMSDSADRTSSAEALPEGSGVLGGLPRTRPQRTSARRAAARAARPDQKRAGGRVGVVPEPAINGQPAEAPAAPSSPGAAQRGSSQRKAPYARTRTRTRTPSTSKNKAPAKQRSKPPPAARARKRAPTSAAGRPAREQVPEQGYEAERDASGPVQPPGGVELLASAAELAGELAKTGVSAGARALKDFISRLPG